MVNLLYALVCKWDPQGLFDWGWRSIDLWNHQKDCLGWNHVNNCKEWFWGIQWWCSIGNCSTLLPNKCIPVQGTHHYFWDRKWVWPLCFVVW